MPTIHPTATVASTAVATGDVTIGAHSRVLHQSVLNGDLGPIVIGEYAVVMEHAVNTTLAPDSTVPIGWIAAGRPAELFSPDRHDDLWAAQEPLDFPGTVYGVPRGTSMIEIMRRQSAALASGA